MNKEYNNQQSRNAFGLVEIIVAIAIFATAMIATVSLAIGSLRTVKDNELADTANAVMVGSMEYMKSPAAVPVLNQLTAGRREFAFSVSSEIDTENPNLTTLRQMDQADVINTCSDSSEYRVVLRDFPDFLVCNQILLQQAAGNSFEIRSIVYYQTSKGISRNELIGYRNTGGSSQ